ncbi:MAG: hypothetical protein JXM70_20355 [Pirellulales bacterium]|nr:hypothetical protein [Pirellulales bacterium]
MITIDLLVFSGLEREPAKTNCTFPEKTNMGVMPVWHVNFDTLRNYY